MVFYLAEILLKNMQHDPSILKQYIHTKKTNNRNKKHYKSTHCFDSCERFTKNII